QMPARFAEIALGVLEAPADEMDLGAQKRDGAGEHATRLQRRRGADQRLVQAPETQERLALVAAQERARRAPEPELLGQGDAAIAGVDGRLEEPEHEVHV